MAVSVAVCDIFSVKEWPDLENRVRVHSRSDLENWLRGLSRSLKLMPFKTFGAVSYSPSIVIMAISAAIFEIFNAKEWPDLEIWVSGPSRSLKKARFDRPCMTFY